MARVLWWRRRPALRQELCAKKTRITIHTGRYEFATTGRVGSAVRLKGKSGGHSNEQRARLRVS